MSGHCRKGIWSLRSKQFPPFTDPAEGTPGAGTLPVGQAVNRLVGYAPLGAFRAGPIGMAQEEDEIQINLRYRF